MFVGQLFRVWEGRREKNAWHIIRLNSHVDVELLFSIFDLTKNNKKLQIEFQNKPQIIFYHALL